MASVRKKEDDMKCYMEQTDALLQGVWTKKLKRIPIVWSISRVDAETQTNESSLLFCNEEGQCDVIEDPILSPVYETLECVYVEMTNKGINNVFLSDWLVSLLAIIRRLNPALVPLSNYYYENEARFPASPLHKLKTTAGVCFMSALDDMCTYNSGSNLRDSFCDNEFLVHYSVAHASRLHGNDFCYVNFCNSPLLYKTTELAIAIDITISDIVNLMKTRRDDGNVSIEWFPPSYIHVVQAVNEMMQSGCNAAKNSVLIQFLPLSTSASKSRTDMTNKEKHFLGVIMRTALMWYMTYILSSNVQDNKMHTYHALLDRCITRDPLVMQSLQQANKGPYMSMGMLVPGLFAYLFYISKETDVTVKLGTQSTNIPLSSLYAQCISEEVESWCTNDFGVRDKMAKFILGDSVLKSDGQRKMSAFGSKGKNTLQGEIDCALFSFLRDILLHRQSYMSTSNVVINYLKEVVSSREYLQASQVTRRAEYKIRNGNDVAFTNMTGFLKNPFLYKLQHTHDFDTYGRGTVQTTRDTMVSTFASQ